MLESAAESFLDEIESNEPVDLAEVAMVVQPLVGGLVRDLRRARRRADLADTAWSAVEASLTLARVAADTTIGRALDIEPDVIDLVTEASRALVAQQLDRAVAAPDSPLPVSASYFSELKNGKKSLPSAAAATKLDSYFSTTIGEIVARARQLAEELREQRRSRPPAPISRFQRAEPGVRDATRRELIQQELSRRADLLDLVEELLALSPEHQRVVADLMRSLNVHVRAS